MKNKQYIIHSFPSPEVPAKHLADFVIECIANGIEEKNHASLVVSGGSTPKPLFEALSGRDCNWHKVSITLTDERWVETTDQESNESLVRENLLQGKAQAASFLGLKNNAATAYEGEKECYSLLCSIPRPFDVVVLGMGNDGHTASLFPGVRRLKQAMDMRSSVNCLALSPDGSAHERMTLTLPVLLDAKQIIIHITGPEKRKVLEQAMTDGPETEMPVQAILKQRKTPVQIYCAP